MGGLPLPLVSRRLPSPYKFIDLLTGSARRSVAARFFTGDLDIAAYSGNWDLTRHSVPSRACAHCYWRYQMSWIEDEWHLLFVCPLYSSRRRALPFRRTQVLVEGHRMQGAGCTERNLTSLVRHIMAFPSMDIVVNLFFQASKLRRVSPPDCVPGGGG